MNTQTQDNSDAVMRAALKMAIEALSEGAYGKEREKAIQACKEALEQPQPKLFLDLSNSNGNHPVQQEPVGYTEPADLESVPQGDTGLWFAKKDERYSVPLYTHPAPSQDFFERGKEIAKWADKRNEQSAPLCDKVSRLEIIDNNGRSYVNWGVDKIEFSYQDYGKTLKIFTNGSGGKPSWCSLSEEEVMRLILINELDNSGDVGFYNLIEQELKTKNGFSDVKEKNES